MILLTKQLRARVKQEDRKVLRATGVFVLSLGFIIASICFNNIQLANVAVVLFVITSWYEYRCYLNLLKDLWEMTQYDDIKDKRSSPSEGTPKG